VKHGPFVSVEVIAVGETGANEVHFFETEKATLFADVDLADIHVAALSDSDFQLRTHIPDGPQVHMLDSRQVKFRWRGGMVVREN